MSNSVLFCDLQRPLTVEDYLKNSLISAFTDIVASVGACCAVAYFSRHALLLRFFVVVATH
jgi:hypothetical protein